MRLFSGFVLLLGLAILTGFVPPKPFYPALQHYCAALPATYDSIPADRRTPLQALAVYIRMQRLAGRKARVVFICTHNTGRSQLAQAWLRAAADWHGLQDIEAYSGGIKPSAFSPGAAEALRRAGFSVMPGEGQAYTVNTGPDYPDWIAYAKRYDDRKNPQKDFCAVMVCAEAENSCPLVPGATRRIVLPFPPIKATPGQPDEASQYDTACLNIAREVFYAVSKVAS